MILQKIQTEGKPFSYLNYEAYILTIKYLATENFIEQKNKFTVLTFFKERKNVGEVWTTIPYSN